ncbi:hypothetical protein Pan97_27670 [Bremerella volcania]|uniref:Uncharacterized protein n=1 Tax=Bremerella volcania TaxID=2527984 RepID=A0A518C919_9BACT|nr:hypothetical protein Pan97_27670 [Bremerella volcania]
MPAAIGRFCSEGGQDLLTARDEACEKLINMVNDSA